jgi:hypothetical protein
VVGVQFLLDGASLGAEQAGPAFSLSWNTATAVNGTHTLSARARDAAGNTTLAANVVVTVANVQPAGLVAAYAFGEGSGSTVADSSGNNNTGTLGTGLTWTTQGKFDNAVVFNGASYITVPASASLNLTTGMTLEAWVYPTAQGSAWRNVVIKERTGGEVYNLYSNVDTLVPTVYVVTSATNSVSGQSQLPLNTWSHLAATYDNATLRLYVNGTQVGSRALTGSLLTSSGALRIGGNAVWGEFFQGRIDEVRIYNRALSQTEIQTDMTRAIGGGASIVFTDDPVVAQSTPARAVHITELRSAINTVRAARGLGAFAWTDPTLTAGSTVVRAVHLAELRTALNQAYQAAGRTAPTYTDPSLVAGGTVIKAIHVNELRAAVRGL